MATMLRLGNITLDAPFYQAGLAGYSDAAMRLVARRHGCPYCITEAMLDAFLIAGGKGLKAAELDDADHPIAGQLMGSHPVDIAEGAKILVGLGYDVVDINLACPVKKIKKRCRGGHLLSAPDEAVAILDAVAQAVGGDVPLTVKLRRSYDDTPEMVAAFHTVMGAAIELGYSGATVHGRTVEQKYLGPAKWPALREIAERYGGEAVRHVFYKPGQSESSSAAPDSSRGDVWKEPGAAFEDSLCPGLNGSTFLIGGSGDIWEAADVFRMLDQTGVGWVSVARGCIGNPWLFEQARAIMRGDMQAANRPPSIPEQREVLLEHFKLSVSLHGEDAASRMMRKFGIKFSRHHPNEVAVKEAFIRVRSLDDWRAVLAAHYQGKAAAAVVPESLAA